MSEKQNNFHIESESNFIYSDPSFYPESQFPNFIVV